MRRQNIINLETEKEGIIVLKKHIPSFFVPTKEQKIYLYTITGVDYKKYSRSIDGVISNVENFDKIKSINDFTFVEIKTTKSKTVKKLPYGVFFGFTKNEEDLFKKLTNYKLCIVHVDRDEYILLNYEEYKSLISNKRIQYQISFKSAGKYNND
jgi:hypothetical protein